jgi:Cof subfamily protein (haloacid dehalogenase superfamily)
MHPPPVKSPQASGTQGHNLRGIRLVLSDVDGTLVTNDKELTPRTLQAIEHMREAGIFFAITSARPAQALTRFIEPLNLDTPLGAFNGALIVDDHMRTIEERAIKKSLPRQIIDALEQHGLNVWAYQGANWFVRDENGPYVAHESQACSCEPTKVANFHGLDEGVLKIVGISDDANAVNGANAAMNDRFARDVSAVQSQSWFLDITNVDATKGNVVKFLAKFYDLELRQIATIGDMHNDVSMFEVAGFSIAMGNAVDAVQGAADVVTTTNEHEGFAHAIETFILP